MPIHSRLYSLAISLAAVTLLAPTPAAHADTFQDFTLAGSFGTAQPLTGTLTLDTTTSQFTYGVFTATANGTVYSFNAAPGSGLIFPSFGLAVVGFYNATSGINIEIPIGSFVGYSGGSLCSATMPCGSFVTYLNTDLNASNDINLQSGSLTLSGAPYMSPAAATPEPSSLLLLATGLIGGVGTCLRRLRRA